MLLLAAGGTAALSTSRGRPWVDGAAPAPWTSWRTLPAPTALAGAGLSSQTGATSGITARRGVSTGKRTTGGLAAAPRLYPRREGTRGTATGPPGRPVTRDTTTPSSPVRWRARPGPGEGSGGPAGRTRTATRPPRAAPGAKAATATTAGRLATVQRRRTPCRRTPSGRRSGTGGPTSPPSGTAPWSRPGRSGTTPASPPPGLSATHAPTTTGRPTPCRGGAGGRTGTGTETW